MPEIRWIKITTDMFDDEKIRLVEAMPDADTLLVIWVKLLCQAGKVNANGYIFLAEDIPFTDENLATIFNRPVNTIRLALTTFVNLRMIELNERGLISLPNWEKHQNIEGLERIREHSRQRVARFREKQKQLQLSCNVSVTTSNALEKSRVDKKKSIYILPDWIDKELWTDFMEIRKKKKAPQTEHALALLIKELEKLKVAGDDPNEVLKKSIMNGWKGVFPLKGGTNGKAGQNPRRGLIPRDKYTTPEQWRQDVELGNPADFKD